MNNQEHIHYPDDGRPHRKVFVNGNLIEQVFYADTKKGIVDFYPEPARIKKGADELYSRRLRGRVTVEFLGG